MSRPRPVIEVVVPVFDEQATLGACVRRLHHHLSTYLPYPFRITVADNASTDATPDVAEALATEFAEVEVLRLAEKGRGRALKRAWLASEADVLAYMDVDLSTDLDAFYPLVAPLLSGHSDVAIGSRLATGARTVRGGRREVISRCYNLLLRLGLDVSFTDAQCGFKAIRADVAQRLLPLVKDDVWFFDTELLVLAQRSGLRIHEVPVDWMDDPDSRVDVMATAREDLAGMRRMRRSFARRELPVAEISAEMGRGRLHSGLMTKVGRFAGVGAMSTLVHLGLFALLGVLGTPAQLANIIGLLAGTIANTSANRAWTFSVHGREHALRHQAQGLAILALTWVTSATALWLVALLAPGVGTGVQTVVLGAANVLATIVKFAVFHRTMAPAGGNGFLLPDDEVTGLTAPPAPAEVGAHPFDVATTVPTQAASPESVPIVDDAPTALTDRARVRVVS